MKTLRSYLADLRKAGELNTINEEVHWDLQAAAISGMAQKAGGPAVHLTKIAGHPGMSMCGALLSGPGYCYGFRERKMQGRIAMAMGLEKDTYYDELIETITERKGSPVRAVAVDSGPVQKNIVEAKDVDLYKFPFPRVHDKDAGRYLTSQVVMTRDPDMGWTNWGVYRLQLLTRNKLALGYWPGLKSRRHIQKMWEDKFLARKQPMPFAISVGVPPSMLLAAMSNTPEGTEEAGIAGGLMLEPIAMIKGRKSDIMVPADIEMVLEGHIYPGDTAQEGPCALISRYSDPAPAQPVLTVESIMYQDNPIIPFVAEGINVSDTVAMFSVMHSQEITEKLLGDMVPVRWVTMPVEGKLCFGIVSLRVHAYAGMPSRIATKIFAQSPFITWLLVLDGDVSSEDLPTALNDMNMKAHPGRGWHVFPNKPVGLTANHDWDTGLASTLYVDAMWRVDRPPELIPRRVSFETSFPEELQDRVIKRWNEELKLTPKAWKARI